MIGREKWERKREKNPPSTMTRHATHFFFTHPNCNQHTYKFFYGTFNISGTTECAINRLLNMEKRKQPAPLLFNWKPISHPSLKWYRICFYFHRKIIDATWGEKSDGERRDKNWGFFLGFCIISIYAINLNKWKNIVVLATRWNQICENIECVWVLVTKQHCRASLNVQELKSPFRVPCVGEYGYV